LFSPLDSPLTGPSPLSTILPATFLPALLELLPSGVVYYLPVTDATGAVVDFTFAYLNPTAQHLLQLPAHPTVTYSQHFTQADADGLAFHRAAYQQAAPAHRTGYYQVDSYDTRYTMQAQRVDEGLVVHFTVEATADQPVFEQASTRQRVAQLNQELELEAQVHARTQEAEAARVTAERQRGELERIFEQAPVAIAVYRGPTYTIELANSTVARLWGRTQEQLLGKGLFEALPEVAGMGYEELLDGVMATGTPHVAHAMEAQHDRNGQRETVYWDFVYVPMHAADGIINGAMVVATEVTAQVRARQQVEQLNQELETRVRERTRQLSEQQRLLAHILEQVPAFIATLSGPEHRFSFFNAPYQQALAGRAALGRSVAEVMPEVVAQGFIGLLDQVYATGQPLVATAAPAQLYDPQRRETRLYHVDLLYQPLFDAQQQVQGILAFLVDVTEKVLAQQAQQVTNEELQRANTQLLRTNTDLDTFVYTASHDLKAPIANIEGLLEALSRNLPAAVTQEPLVARLLALMSGAVDRFRQTIAHLTNIVQLQQLEPPVAVRLSALVTDVQLDLAPLLEATAATLTLTVDEDEPVHVPANTLRSVLYNLLSNALKYRAPDRASQVALRVQCLSDHVVVQVQDNGLGLNESQQARLFGLFRRLHTHVEGSGVGLYTVKRLVENAGGTITVQSRPNVGSTFTVSLPF